VRVHFSADWFEDIPEATAFEPGDKVEVEGNELTVWEVQVPLYKSMEGDLKVNLSDLNRAYHRERLEWARKKKESPEGPSAGR